MKVKLVINPDLDAFIGHIGGPEIPTKQDKFKAIICEEIIIVHHNGDRDVIKGDLYLMNHKLKESQRIFEDDFKKWIKSQTTQEHPYPRNVKLELIVTVSMTKKRIEEVDIDNLLKIILDCCNNLIFEDDSQVISIIANKKVIEDDLVPPLNAIMIGVRKLNNDKPSIIGNYQLYSFVEVNN